MKILCVGDGFGKGHIWPMWPQILENVRSEGNSYKFICEIDNVYAKLVQEMNIL